MKNDHYTISRAFFIVYFGVFVREYFSYYILAILMVVGTTTEHAMVVGMTFIPIMVMVMVMVMVIVIMVMVVYSQI